jgi:hypothetical protein
MLELIFIFKILIYIETQSARLMQFMYSLLTLGKFTYE